MVNKVKNIHIGRRIAGMIESMQAAGGPPSAEQMASMQALREKQAQYGSWLAILLAIAVVGMSIAEYLTF